VPLCLVAAALAALASLRLLRQRPDYAIRHVVLISLDTCRPDRLSCYGYPKKTTPNIDRLAAHGVLFANAYTPIPTTLPAHCSMMTGQIPPIHGVFSQGVFLPPAAHTLAETLKTEGFTTGAFTSSFVLDSRFSMDQGFDTYDDDFPDSPYNARRRPGDQTSARAMKWLEDNADANRLFLFAHYFDAHAHFGSYVDTKGSFFSPVPLTEDFTNDPYASGVAFADHCVGMVIDKLKELGLYESTLIIITGDHGEMLGEHGEDYHGYFIYESNIRVPLVIRLPNQTQARRVEDAVGLIDILPTVCSLLNIPPPHVCPVRISAPIFGPRRPPTGSPATSTAKAPWPNACTTPTCCSAWSGPTTSTSTPRNRSCSAGEPTRPRPTISWPTSPTAPGSWPATWKTS